MSVYEDGTSGLRLPHSGSSSMNRPYLIFLTAAVISVLLTIFFYTTEPHLLLSTHLPSWKGAPSHVKTGTSKHKPIDASNDLVELAATTTTSVIQPATTLTGLPPNKEESNELSGSETDQSIDPTQSAGEQIPPAALVIATISETNNSWLDLELDGLLGPGRRYMPYIYVNDDRTAPLHTPKNRGNEAMVYLTYIIDNYDALLPINIFIHGHAVAWHNNMILGYSTSQLLRRLDFDKVLEDGYYNLRCHFNPGCPEHLYPFATEYDVGKAEELLIKDAWQEIFQVPEWQVPGVLAQPCCSQFAVTAERIRSVPRERYVHFQRWLLYTPMSDFMTGRVFEYLWQYVFLDKAVWCLDPRVCYCGGYGVCYEDPQDYDEWMDLNHKWARLDRRLGAWKKAMDKAGATGKRDIEGGSLVVEDVEDFAFARMGRRELEQEAEHWMQSEFSVMERKKTRREAAGAKPVDHGEWLTQEKNKIADELARRTEVALACGARPACKAAALKATDGLIAPLSEDTGKPQKT